ncbi:MAG TPA: hypothetical protein VIP75_04055 [Acidothermales bacterium]|nr:hypothetical protein [Actinomycetes bacterium]
MSLSRARTVADAVLYEGYLLYPYRSSSRKNQVRWQFGVLGPPGAAAAGVGEEPDMAVQCLVRCDGDDAGVQVYLRFLQLQARSVERAANNSFARVPELHVAGITHVAWDEAVEREQPLGPYSMRELRSGVTVPVLMPGGEDVEELRDDAGEVVGRLVRRREQVTAQVTLSAVPDASVDRLEIRVENIGPDPQADKDAATRTSLLGAHLLLVALDGTAFVSVLDPPGDARDAASRCMQHRCWPVLTGNEGDTDIVLASPIILYDYPAVAPESAGALFDSTEIDEILTLRVLTLTDEEKAEARATDVHAAAIIDRCEAMTPDELQRLHGVLRDPHGPVAQSFDDEGAVFDTGDAPWWDPSVDASVRPELDAVIIAGTAVRKGSIVRIHPNRRADAHDLFYADQVARVAAVHRDVDGETHVAVVLVDDPAADLHDWYGRYLHFAPDELEPLHETVTPEREEN